MLVRVPFCLQILLNRRMRRKWRGLEGKCERKKSTKWYSREKTLVYRFRVREKWSSVVYLVIILEKKIEYTWISKMVCICHKRISHYSVVRPDCVIEIFFLSLSLQMFIILEFRTYLVWVSNPLGLFTELGVTITLLKVFMFYIKGTKQEIRL